MRTEPLRLVRTITYVTLVVTLLTLCVPYALLGRWTWAVAALWLFAIAVPVPDLPSWGRVVSNVTFAGTVILAGNAAAQLGSTISALIAVTAATATWDLQHLIHRLPPEPAAQPPTSELAASQHSASDPATSEPTPTSEQPADARLLDRGRLARSAPLQEQTTDESQAILSDRGRLARSAAPQERTIEEPDTRTTLVRAHLQRLALTLGTSLSLGAAALVIRVDYSIRTLAVLTLVLLVGLGGAVAYLRRASD
jgi:hypothetical protein